MSIDPQDVYTEREGGSGGQTGWEQVAGMAGAQFRKESAMRDATEIQVQQLAVHILDPHGPRKLILSETVSPLEGNERLHDYFASHIENSLGDPSTKAAQFEAIAENTAAGVCKGILAGSLDLVAGSRQLATWLYEIMGKNKAISAGDLVACLFRAGNHPETPRFLALLKLDPAEVLRHVVAQDKQGRRFVQFLVQEDVLPTTRERLQKCAFVQPLEPRPDDYDLMLLDRQVRRPEERAVAKYFSEDFLACEMALDARQRTHRFYRGAISAYNTLLPRLTEQQEDALRQSIDTAVGSKTLDVDVWVSGLPLPEKDRGEVDQIVSKELPDRTFDLDQDHAQKLLQQKRFRGDFGLRVSVRADKYAQVVKQAKWCEEEGEPGYYEIVLHSKIWREVT